ncbi:unnamed protein product [Caenorhabditis angaria]|uniref:Uncharacterized protein n=1 Tax=Caenorhabditis angaria TaxID=860376 RepID=A0A9P1I7P2_9PELO|nr:unnamed protein product [Caenorhabditis angaria]
MSLRYSNICYYIILVTMITQLIFCLFFALQINAGVIPTFSSFNMSQELSKIEKSCLSQEDHDEISGNKYKTGWAQVFNLRTIYLSLEVIVNSEMRKVLGLSQYSGTYQNHKFASDKQLKDASNFEEYFDLQTLGGIGYVAKNEAITDEDLITAIQFLDKKWPAIRIILRNKFEKYIETAKNHKGFQTGKNYEWKQDRKIVNGLIIAHYEMQNGVWDAISEMYYNKKCQQFPRPDSSHSFFKTLKKSVMKD